jgi:IclR family pca regulon transcriptional regulator
VEDREINRDSSDFVDALERGLDVIQAFTSDAPEMTLSEVAKRTGLSPATARRSLLTLRELGYIGMNGRHFLLRQKVLSLGAAFINSMNLRDVADPYLQELAETFHDAASMTVLDGMDVVYIAHVPSRREVRFRVAIGTHRPAYATSMGHVLLAELDAEKQAEFLSHAPFQAYTSRTTTKASELRAIFKAAKRDGYAAVQDQLEYGSVAVAVAVRDSRGRAFAAINCSGETSRVDIKTMIAARLPKLQAAAAHIGEAAARYPALLHSIDANT